MRSLKSGVIVMSLRQSVRDKVQKCVSSNATKEIIEMRCLTNYKYLRVIIER